MKSQNQSVLNISKNYALQLYSNAIQKLQSRRRAYCSSQDCQTIPTILFPIDFKKIHLEIKFSERYLKIKKVERIFGLFFIFKNAIMNLESRNWKSEF